MISVFMCVCVAHLDKRTIYDQRNKLNYYFTSRMRSIRPGEPKANPAGRDNILSGYFGAATPAGG